MNTILLSVEEQLELVRQAQCGDRDALNRLIQAQYALVYDVAKGFLDQSAGYDIDDLVQEGLLAAVEAIKYYRPERGYKLSTYVGDCARRRIWKYLKRANQRPLPQFSPLSERIDWVRAERALHHTIRVGILVDEATDRLNPLDRQILQTVYGLNEGGAESSSQQLAELLGLRRSTVDRLHRTALERARRQLQQLHSQVETATG